MNRKRSLAATFLASAAVAALAIVPLVTPAGAALTRGTLSVTLTDSRPDPARVMRVGDTAVLTGRATGLSTNSVVVLQVRNAGGAWRRAARGPLRAGGRIRLLWHIHQAAQGKIDWRVIIKLSGRIVGQTGAQSLTVGSAYIACRLPGAQFTVPAGDGWVVGGLYYAGGAYPGIDRCSSKRYKALAIDNNDNAAGSQSVAGGQGYRIFLKPGSYVMQAAGCAGPRVKVLAGQGVHADVFCNVP